MHRALIGSNSCVLECLREHFERFKVDPFGRVSRFKEHRRFPLVRRRFSFTLCGVEPPAALPAQAHSLRRSRQFGARAGISCRSTSLCAHCPAAHHSSSSPFLLFRAANSESPARSSRSRGCRRTKRRLPRNVHDAVAAGTAGADAPLPVETFDEHFERPPFDLAVELPLDFLLNRHEAREATRRLWRRDVVFPAERGGPRARRIRERENSGEPHVFEERERRRRSRRPSRPESPR